MTDNEIIRVLNHIVGLYDKDLTTICGIRLGTLCGDALDLINRQKAEIERLQAMVNAELDTIHKLGDDYERALEEEQERVKKAKAEAIKEFAERLKEYSYHPIRMPEEYRTVAIEAINSLVKEMVGDAE